MRPIALTLAALLAATPALADEAWETNRGFVVWESSDDQDAILALFPTGEAGTPALRLVVPGLGADMLGGRGTYLGVWMGDSGDVACATEMVDPIKGTPTRYWGTFTLTFLSPDFPSDWAGAYGACLEPVTQTIQAHALVGEARRRAP